MDESFLKRLRRETRDQHTALESRMGIGNFLKTQQGYRQLLGAFWGLYRAFEARLEHGRGEIEGILPDAAKRMRSQKLLEDLKSVGVATAPPRLADVSPLATIPEKLGCFYVLEGSTLGGQVLCREIEQKLGYTSNAGASFFHGYGDETGAMWKKFCLALETYAREHTSDQKVIIATARSVFSDFEREMGRYN